MEEALRAYLKADDGVKALTGGASARVDWGARPQGSALPAISLHLISAPRTYHMRGRVRLVGTLVQMDCWADSFAAAKALARALAGQGGARGALDRLNENPPAGIDSAVIENERGPSFDPPGSITSTNLYRASLDVRVWSTTA